MRYISPTADGRLMLVAYWLPAGNSCRLIIIALRVSLLTVLTSEARRK
jgi:hypothetical protein